MYDGIEIDSSGKLTIKRLRHLLTFLRSTIDMSVPEKIQPSLLPRPSHRITTLVPAIIDDLIQDHCNVRFNLAPGSPCTVPHADCIASATAHLTQSGTVESLSRYDKVCGIEALRKRWANYLYNPEYLDSPSSKHFVEQPLDTLLPHHELMITAGANQAFVNVVFAICDPHDEVLLPIPYYFSHKNALALADVRANLIRPDPGTLLPTIAAVASAVTPRTRALVITNPSNPTGAVYPKSLLIALSEFCAAKAIYLILDEAYLEYNFSENKSFPSRIYSPHLQSHIIKLHTMSKAFGLAGWRVGCVAYPRDLSVHMCKVQDTIPTHASNFSQVVALSALKLPTSHVSEAAKIRHVFIHALTNLFNGTPLQHRFVIPKGAFYVFVPYTPFPSQSKAQDDDKVVHKLANTFEVLAVPGYIFGLTGYIRVCYGAVRLDDAHRAAKALGNGLRFFLEESNTTSNSLHLRKKQTEHEATLIQNCQSPI